MATVNPFNVKSILRAIAQIAMDTGATVNDLPTPYTGSKLYAAPTQGQLENAATPYLSVSRPRLVGYAVGGELVGPEAAHGAGLVEPAWDFDVWSFHPYDPDWPNYDDATDDIVNLWDVFMVQYTLPYYSIVQAGSTSNQIVVEPGTGKRFRRNFMVTVDGMQVGPVADIVDDTLVLYSGMGSAPTTGSRASQGTCGNSYPFNASPDYAQLANGGAWTVGYLTIRAFEQLLSNFP